MSETFDEIFNLEFPVTVYQDIVTWEGEEVNGLYEWDGSEHSITIHDSIILDSTEWEDTLAHEYIHAWQSEMGLKLSHGKVFKWWAKKLADYGYQVSKRQ